MIPRPRRPNRFRSTTRPRPLARPHAPSASRVETLEDRALLTVLINEVHFDPAGGLDGDANGDGTRDFSQDEFVEIVNDDPTNSVDISGWTLSDDDGGDFVFGAGTVLGANQAAVLFGGGTPTGAFGGALVFVDDGSIGSGLANGGDLIELRDDTATLIDSFGYGSAGPNTGGSDQSITRSPDVTGGFVDHTAAAGSGGALFSPGTRVDGSAFGGGAVNNPPVVDLNGAADPGLDFAVAFAGTPVNVADADAAVTDDDGDPLAELVLTVSGVRDGADETLTVAGQSFALNADFLSTGMGGGTVFEIRYTAADGVLQLTENTGGTIPTADAQALVRGVTYDNAAAEPTFGTRTIDFVADDGANDSAVATGTISAGTPAGVTNAVDDGPYSATAGTPLTVTAANGVLANDVGTLRLESFEADPSGTTYTLDDPFDANFDFFGRFPAPDNSNGARDDFQAGFDGAFAVFGQDHDGQGGAATRTVGITPFDVTGATELSVTVSLGAADSTNFDNFEAADGDGIRIFATLDGTRTLIGEFAPPALGAAGTANAGNLALDTDGDGVGDGPELTAELRDFTFAVAGTGASMAVDLELTSTDSFEPLAVDHVRVAGTPAGTATVVDDVDNGTLTLNADGSFTYTANAGFSGTDSFTYQLASGGLTDTAVATIDVAAGTPNNPPVARDDDFTTDEDTTLSGENVFVDNGNGVDSDPDMDFLALTAVGGSAAGVGNPVAGSNGGRFTIDIGGALDFDPNGDFEALAAGQSAVTTVTYTISDGSATDTALVTVTVTGVDEAINADLSVTQTDAPDPIQTGGQSVYTVVVTNNGPEDVTGARLDTTLEFPGGTFTVLNPTLSFSAMGATTGSGTLVPSQQGPDVSGLNLAAGQTATLRYTVRADTGTGTITNTAVASGVPGDPVAANNTAVGNTTVVSATSNRAPVADAGGPYVIDEGDDLRLDGTGSFDPDGGPVTYRWDVDGDGDFDENVTGAMPTVTWEQLVALGIDDGPDGPRNLVLEVTDGAGQTNSVDTDATTLRVDNVVPEDLTFTGPSSVVPGESVTFTGTFTDPGSADTHTGVVDWGDGTISEATITRNADGSSSVSATHTYNSSGTFTVQLTVTDDDGGAAVEQATTTALAAAVLADDLRGGTSLFIVGTNRNDNIRIYRLGTGFGVTFNGARLGPFAAADRVVVRAGDGADRVSVSRTVNGQVSVPTVIFGEGGRDLLEGGNGNDLLVGGQGADRLIGFGGNNVLVGGTGGDLILGGSGNDLSVAGTIDLSARGVTGTEAALDSVADVWFNGRPFDARVGQLAPVLDVNETVFDDGNRDVLRGGSNLDWYFAQLGANDSVFDSGGRSVFNDNSDVMA